MDIFVGSPLQIYYQDAPGDYLVALGGLTTEDIPGGGLVFFRKTRMNPTQLLQVGRSIVGDVPETLFDGKHGIIQPGTDLATSLKGKIFCGWLAGIQA